VCQAAQTRIRRSWTASGVLFGHRCLGARLLSKYQKTDVPIMSRLLVETRLELAEESASATPRPAIGAVP